VGPAAAEGDVYRLSVTATSGQVSGQWTEWVAPVSGRWRIESDRTYVYTGSAYVASAASSGTYVRAGSAAFLGSLPNRAVTRDPLRVFLAGGSAGITVVTLPDGRPELSFRRGSTAYVAVVDERVSAAEADGRKLFAVPVEQVTSSATERRIGERPSGRVTAYWLGAAYAGRRATTAVEEYAGPSPDQRSRESRPREAVTSFTVFYELPAAKGRSSAIPGARAPGGELRVLSQPVTSSVAQRAIQAYNGRSGDLRYRPWPRASVTLKAGETVTVIPDLSRGATAIRQGFAVVTRTTLVYVSGTFKLNDIPRAAAALRALGPARRRG